MMRQILVTFILCLIELARCCPYDYDDYDMIFDKLPDLVHSIKLNEKEKSGTPIY